MNRDNFTYQLQIKLKRAIDLVVAAIALLVWLPFMICIGLAIKLTSPGPIFFRHRRIGKDGRPFDLYKFRTMVTGGDDSTYMNYLRELIESEKKGDSQGLPYRKMAEDARVTRVGKFLRCYYLDELPQIINILRGEMSLVGPRPHVQFEVDNYTPSQRGRLAVKPGATGLWQVEGKADCTFCELIARDLEYIDHWSILLDLNIMFKTVGILFRGGEKFWTRMSKSIPQKTEESPQTTVSPTMIPSRSKMRHFKALITPHHPRRKHSVESDTPFNQLPFKE